MAPCHLDPGIGFAALRVAGKSGIGGRYRFAD